MQNEIIDLLDEKGKTIGTIDKAIAHNDGLWHRSTHVWIVNSKGEMLFQKRCADKSFYPNFWDCSASGHIGAGEDSKTAALREGFEEIGVDFKEDELRFLFTFKEKLVWKDIRSNEFVDVYLVKKDINEADLSYQKEEVSGSKFFNIKWFYENLKNPEFFPHYEEYEMLKEYIL